MDTLSYKKVEGGKVIAAPDVLRTLATEVGIHRSPVRDGLAAALDGLADSPFIRELELAVGDGDAEERKAALRVLARRAGAHLDRLNVPSAIILALAGAQPDDVAEVREAIATLVGGEWQEWK